ncbi:threonine--tRNA ligase 1, cytoplasmic isoform X1 [Tachysurus ichikawai]
MFLFVSVRGVSSTEFGDLELLCKGIVKDKQPFERLEISKETLLEMFKYNKFKCRILNEKVTTPTTTVYRCGPLIDLCRGPHVRHTGKIKAMKIYKNSSTYWEGRSDMETLQRIYGISFPDAKMLKEWERFQEEAKNRDHRKIGKTYATALKLEDLENSLSWKLRADLMPCVTSSPCGDGKLWHCASSY